MCDRDVIFLVESKGNRRSFPVPLSLKWLLGKRREPVPRVAAKRLIETRIIVRLIYFAATIAHVATASSSWTTFANTLI